MGTLTNTTGQDNVPGATRSGTVGDSPFTEVLLEFAHSGSDEMMLFWKLETGTTFVWNMKTINPIITTQPQNVTISYFQRIFVKSICEKKAAYVWLMTTYCSDKPLLAHQLYDQHDQKILQDLSARLGAVEFEGACPCK
jgi:hypothetical protein